MVESGWTYRLIAVDEGDGDFCLGIHEVYTDRDGGISWTSDPIAPVGVGNTHPRALGELERVFHRQRLAFDKPILRIVQDGDSETLEEVDA